MVPGVVPMSEAQAAWTAAFLEAQKTFPKIAKGEKVNTGSYSYTYAALPDIIDLVKPKLHKNGLTITQSVQGSLGEIAVETRIHHIGGHVEVFGPLVLPAGRDAQAAGSAISYARRYGLTAALGIAPDLDDDGAKASAPREEPVALTGRQWLWNESAVFKAWSEDERKEALRAAVKYLGYGEDEALNRDQASAVLNHVAEVYEKRPLPDQEALPV